MLSKKRCKIGATFVLITNRKSHMSFRLVPNSVTLDDLERRNSSFSDISFMAIFAGVTPSESDKSETLRTR